ncbi:hypothetical protein TBLA_0B07410 [Henningerozyma blattae CBS 6284]|uniref:Dol-P-Glc:Glc(2)Man(9)GlcNAc(2)-PP-Dol alpha-1,2-glucosyltransferase n=1 Tax=Henningerozyma blattae (strain ATCC 34711 / CBS 6284 / DSM 70876 / NBRC 10599 / NRRL Y-10934 / UCD 77-7) TaxID=1071380 RepID=I2GZK7_HENB6|nr:hypothetical protein TBLA_0B07410 [Tetrapisispora blattae CBS 6284]CCH59559.1 hypothetical protein TBLA_0B07410 [Tetrapisispora blattae CBS 6284]
MNIILYILLLIYFLITFKIINTQVVPFDFIDEKFHVNQTIEYIKGNWFNWDPKITTPPGLYIMGWLNWKFFHYIFNWSTRCILRMTNLLGGAVILPLIVLRPLFFHNAIGFWPINLMIFPLLSMYYYLYYTDVWSSILILESLTLMLTRPVGKYSIWASSIVGGLSCCFRQTNIIWNAYIMVVGLERETMMKKGFNQSHLNNYIKVLINSIEEFPRIVLPFFINFALFLIFIIWNGSITLGDKANHVAGLHLVQIFYCIMFIMIFSIPIWISRRFLENYLIRCLLKPFRTFFEIIGIMLVIRYFTVIHPFLLADNRHYTFYLFKRIINNPYKIIKYGFMSGVYHFSTFVYYEVLRPCELLSSSLQPLVVEDIKEMPLQLTHVSWSALILCTLATVVPSPLFEPRYYILPYLFWRLAITCSAQPFIDDSISDAPKTSDTGVTIVTGTRRLFYEFLWFGLINIFMLIVFIKKPFIWETEENPQHIMW